MKRWLAFMVCFGINGVAVHLAMAQNPTPRAHAVVVTGHAGGYLGVGVRDVDEDRAKALKLTEDYGVEIKNVAPGSPAEKAGLKPSDVVLEYNGQRVEGGDQFSRLVRETPANRKVVLKIARNGATQIVTAMMGVRAASVWSGSDLGNGFHFEMPELPEIPEVPEAPEAPEAPEPPEVPWVSPRVWTFDAPHPVLSWNQGTIGIETEPLSAQLAEYFGVKSGILVRSVVKNSPAEKSGMKAGDVITRVGANGVASPQELSRQVRELRSRKEPVALGVVRNHRELTLSVAPSMRWPSNDDTPALNPFNPNPK